VCVCVYIVRVLVFVYSTVVGVGSVVMLHNGVTIEVHTCAVCCGRSMGGCGVKCVEATGVTARLVVFTGS
jgi:hypothetical protein